MAMHKASSRRIEVLSRTTGNVDEVRFFHSGIRALSVCTTEGYERAWNEPKLLYVRARSSGGHIPRIQQAGCKKLVVFTCDRTME